MMHLKENLGKNSFSTLTLFFWVTEKSQNTSEYSVFSDTQAAGQ